MEIIDMPIAYNKSNKKEGIKYIVIHDTGNTSKGAGVRNHFSFFNGGDRQSSANYFVDDKEIGRFVNPNLFYSWHCGDGKGKNGITNSNSIGVEICINSDGEYNKTIQNTIWLVQRLMKDFNIPIDRVVRHKDASGKNCPKLLNEGDIYTWSDFKKMLNNEPVIEVVDIYWRVVDSSYKDKSQADKRANEIGGFVVKYIKEK